MGQFIALMVEGEETLEECQELWGQKMYQGSVTTIINMLVLGLPAPLTPNTNGL